MKHVRKVTAIEVVCICDRCGITVKLPDGGSTELPVGWSLLSSTAGRTLSLGDRFASREQSVSYATVCDRCHSTMFGPFWDLRMSTNGGPDYALNPPSGAAFASVPDGTA